MKGVFVLLDGLGDLPLDSLGGKTPLEAAKTPNLDFFASQGELGTLYPVRKGFVPESHHGILSLFGNPTHTPTRGQLEALGSGIKISKGDLALRVNFATINDLKKGNVLDRRAGRTLTTREATLLAETLQREIKLPVPFVFKSTVQHRGVLVFRGGLSDMISSNDFFYDTSEGSSRENKIRLCKSTNEDEEALYTVNVVNSFLEQVYALLQEHPVNELRRAKGLLPANYLLIRGGGTETPKVLAYPHWTALVYMPLEIGFAQLSKMRVISFDYPPLKDFDVYENLHTGLKKACKHAVKMIKKYSTRSAYFYIHIKETDLPGHDNKPHEKIAMLEYLDSTLFKFLAQLSQKHDFSLIVTGDHATPCKLKAHSADAVPLLFYSGRKPSSSRQHFCERDASQGSFGELTGKELFKKAGFGK